MDIYFVEQEQGDRAYFELALPEHTVHFVKSLQHVPKNARILSVFIHSNVDAEFLETHPDLQLIATRSTTTDHIDLPLCSRRGVTVCNVPRYGKYTVAEHTFALLLALTRRLRAAGEAHRKPGFSYEALRGIRLRGKTLGVLGAGTIGSRVLHLGRGFGMKRIAHDIAPRPELAARLEFEYVSFAELVERSHVISLHATLTPQTYHIFNRETFAKCRPGVIIINTARGALIDSKALVEALDTGQVGGAGLDVLEDERVFRREVWQIVSTQIVDNLQTAFRETEARGQDPQRIHELTTLVHNEELLARPNVFFTPHIGFNSTEAIECIKRETLSSIEGFLKGKCVNAVASSTRVGATSTTTSIAVSPDEARRSVG